MAVEQSNTLTEGVEILKPRTDNREYRRIVLQNMLQVLLISDPDTDKCAASMSVSVGSFSDPQGLEGLAHFLEHTLFYTSEKYPDEDSYSKYVTEVAALKQLKKQELIDFFNEYIKIGAARKKSLSIRIYGSKHLKEMASDKDEVPSPSVEIEDIVGFRKSQPLHWSFRGCGQPRI